MIETNQLLENLKGWEIFSGESYGKAKSSFLAAGAAVSAAVWSNAVSHSGRHIENDIWTSRYVCM
jgi:hypothetical protein